MWPLKLIKVTKIWLIFISSKQCIYAILVKIHQLVLKITLGNHISNISKSHCDFWNKVKVTKIKSTRSSLPSIYLRKVGQNPSTGSEDNAQKRSYADANAEADGIHIKNMSPILWLGDITLWDGYLYDLTMLQVCWSIHIVTYSVETIWYDVKEIFWIFSYFKRGLFWGGEVPRGGPSPT